jgi:hypothetical protein
MTTERRGWTVDKGQMKEEEEVKVGKGATNHLADYSSQGSPGISKTKAGSKEM